MGNTQQLEITYQHYLEQRADKNLVTNLSKELRRIELVDEADALALYHKKGDGATFIWKTGVLAGKRCFVGRWKPDNAEYGDLWFDTIQLMPMIFLQNLPTYSPDSICWLALQPVRIWQFRVFLRVVSWEFWRRDFVSVQDCFDLKRFEDLDGTTPVKQVYWEEACAYAHWFHMFITSTIEIKAAKELLQASIFDQIMPPSYHFWDQDRFLPNEFLRVAVSQKTFNMDGKTQMIQAATSVEKIDPEERVLFNEWENRFDISFIVCLPTRAKLKELNKVPARLSEFIQLNNLAPRK
ncbi:MAG: hypothetical protein LCI00_31065 [Chloroflexi bacterium]|nr:hypothetical protein [Chloroflexota bacterium]MCC6893325.1 hypothetical protein [Anaerolineae bacterium]